MSKCNVAQPMADIKLHRMQTMNTQLATPVILLPQKRHLSFMRAVYLQGETNF
ncbi:MAG: hypothetical protein HC765_01500 [Brachymonas sp.]|nr:hypothetical protein [Brachymonas sp.]